MNMIDSFNFKFDIVSWKNNNKNLGKKIVMKI